MKIMSLNLNIKGKLLKRVFIKFLLSFLEGLNQLLSLSQNCGKIDTANSHIYNQM